MVEVAWDDSGVICEAAFAGDDLPTAVLSPIVGRPKLSGIMVGMDPKDSLYEKVVENMQVPAKSEDRD